MQLKTMAGLLCALAAGACADATAPADSPQAAPASAAFHKSGGGSGGTVSVIAPKPVTLPFSTVDCNGDLVTGTSTHYVVAVAAQGTTGTFDLTSSFDAVSATGPTGVKYAGSNLLVNTAVLNQNATVFITDQNFDLKPSSRTLKDTFLDIVTEYVATPTGPVLSNVSITTKCTDGAKKH